MRATRTGAATAWVLADDPIERRGYRLFVAETPGIELVQEGDFSQEFILNAIRSAPALAVLVASPHDAREAVTMFARLPMPFPVVLVTSTSDHLVAKFWRDGAVRGLIRKGCGVERFKECLHYVRRGERFLEPGLEREMRKMRSEERRATVQLTDRESELLRHLGRGLKLKDAAAKMAISCKTAESHRTRLMRKLAVENRAELIHYAVSAGIVPTKGAAVPDRGVEREQDR